ncbi:ABC transporter permease [Jiangella aurantiaca]|uniref:ABC transporter permease n=1 Tax=Jiangella aurantiaca TaxID=2530373 RepID=A0A4R5AEW3_9ACTN|nr:ABC transporter permease [Jiangella aurantiaca]TDD68462.1 ABC transporter permease [Jiangella aurantiaca]
MLSFLGRRLLYMVPTLFLISVVSFAIIQLPPGDYLTALTSEMEAQGETVDNVQLEALRARYGLGEPFHVQYWKWISGIVSDLDFGQSFEWGRPVSTLLADRLPLTVALAGATLLFTWLVALPIGIYSAVKQYSIGDYLATTLGLLGLATPNFLLALLLMWIAFSTFGLSVGRPNAVTLAIAVVVLGTAGTAGLIRILRANLLDELRKPYVVAARAQGLPERRLLVKYPLRVAMNPFFSTIGWLLPGLVGGEVIVATVINLDTVGPLLLGALQSQDMYLAGSIILILSALTVIGTLISDIALAWLDPRVRLRYR